MDVTMGAWRRVAWRRPAVSSRFPIALAEAFLIALLAVLCAILFWVVATPRGPLGAWRSGAADDASAPVLARFDPFFRLAPGTGPAVVTSAPVKLFGVRLDQATGRGSAIIATPDGVQSSYAVGDEIMPGLILKAVMLDHVTIERGGAVEQLFLDQSVAAPVAQPGAAPAPAAAVSVPNAAALRAGLGFAPRLESGAVTGFVVSPSGSGDVFRSIGFLPGDVVTAINGRRFRTVQEAGETIDGLAAGAVVQIELERGGKVTTLNMRLGQ
jgi:general secretion pathway protein C